MVLFSHQSSQPSGFSADEIPEMVFENISLYLHGFVALGGDMLDKLDTTFRGFNHSAANSETGCVATEHVGGRMLSISVQIRIMADWFLPRNTTGQLNR